MNENKGLVNKTSTMQHVISTFYRKAVASKSEVIAHTGLSPASVNNLIQSLVKDGILEETTLGKSSGGRPPMLYKLCDGAFNVLNYRVTPDGIIASVCDHNGKILFSKMLSYQIQGKEAFTVAFNKITEEIKRATPLFESVQAIGMMMPGILSYSDCIVTLSNPLKIAKFDVSKLVEDTFGRRVNLSLFHDSDALLLGEYFFGNHKDASNMAYVYIGKGVGFSIITDDHLYSSDNCGMELGHTVIDMDGELCSCGLRGCVNTILGEKNVVDRYLKLSDNKVLDISKLDYKTLYELSREGDEAAVQVIGEQVKVLGITLVNMVNLLNPGQIILGGDIASAPLMVNEVQEFVRAHALLPFGKVTHIRGSKLDISCSLMAMAVKISGELFFKQFI